MFLLLEPYLRILYAGLLGALIGWEREVAARRRPAHADHRAVSSALFVVGRRGGPTTAR